MRIVLMLLTENCLKVTLHQYKVINIIIKYKVININNLLLEYILIHQQEFLIADAV